MKKYSSSSLFFKYLRLKLGQITSFIPSFSGTPTYQPSGIFFTHAASTPLTNIAINLESALSRLRHHPQWQQEALHLEQALLDTKHLQRLFLQKRHKSKCFKVNSATQEVIIRLHNPAQRKCIKSSLFIPETVCLSGSVFQFQEALSCLISNAFEAYPKFKEKHIAILAFSAQKQLHFYICDTGEGMPWIAQQLIGTIGLTTKSTGHGKGMAFAKKVIETEFKGTLRIYSDPHHGTTVNVTIPLKHVTCTHNP